MAAPFRDRWWAGHALAFRDRGCDADGMKNRCWRRRAQAAALIHIRLESYRPDRDWVQAAVRGRMPDEDQRQISRGGRGCSAGVGAPGFGRRADYRGARTRGPGLGRNRRSRVVQVVSVTGCWPQKLMTRRWGGASDGGRALGQHWPACVQLRPQAEQIVRHCGYRPRAAAVAPPRPRRGARWGPCRARH
jgi:hypothetical protein